MALHERKTVLIVEDELLIAESEKLLLENTGYSVIIAQSGENAVLTIREGSVPVDIILMDINLGKGIDGPEAAQQILGIREIPIIFLSSHTEKSVVEKTEAITNYGYVVKNSNITVLDTSIKMAFKLFEAYMNIKQQRHDLESANVKMKTINDELIRSEELLKKNESEIRNKLKAIIEPSGDIRALELADIIDYQSIQSLMEDFFKLTGILGAILDIKGNILVATGWQDICTKFHRCNEKTAAFCMESDTELTSGVPEGTYKLYRCRNNMWDMVTPLIIDNCHIGNIFIGQFIFDDENPDTELFRAQARKYSFDEKEYLDALSRVPRFSREKANIGMAFYSKVAKMISSLSYSSIKLSRTIEQQKRAEDEVRRLLSEKELILKEVHHRMKNNFGIIHSILSLQASEQENHDVGNVLLDAAGRVESMRLLYDKLYQSEGYSSVSLKEYLTVLVNEITDIYLKRFNLTLDIQIDDAFLDTKTVSAMGIIVNEMITNSMKYAFAGRTSRLIQLKSRTEDGMIHFAYEDDGIGIPEHVSFEKSSGFGMKLIGILVKQIGGTICIDRTSGKRFVLDFGYVHPS